MAVFGLPGGAEVWIFIVVMGFYGLMGVGFFYLMYLAISKGVARGIREGLRQAPPTPQLPGADDKPTSR